MKVLLINGSPNKNGCTHTALRAAADTLQALGIDTQTLHIGAKPISGCIDCSACRRAGDNRCALPDTPLVNECIGQIERADGLIVGSPVYFAAPNGTLCALLDRVFAHSDLFARKPAAAVVSARRAGASAALDRLLKYFTIAEMPVVSSSYWCMVHGSAPEDVLRDAEGLQTVRNMARNMAWMLRCFEAGRLAGVKPPEAESGSRTDFIR